MTDERYRSRNAASSAGRGGLRESSVTIGASCASSAFLEAVKAATILTVDACCLSSPTNGRPTNPGPTRVARLCLTHAEPGVDFRIIQMYTARSVQAQPDLLVHLSMNVMLG